MQKQKQFQDYTPTFSPNFKVLDRKVISKVSDRLCFIPVVETQAPEQHQTLCLR
ncbi:MULTISPECIES: hypothetical protein [Leptolyngbya]|uniref:hypothetical protein n=1 Tax=Leptolyngbya TaxID=47251 RepID=UPI0019B861E2|nr:hypothetical protein [Leptolyngbya sp. GGD]MBD1855854.1 hypothetical protein [Leptolyngbya sp. FACHB-1624]MCY6491746.1 hypothetical protein [Leptolyngbya sp. GGD]